MLNIYLFIYLFMYLFIIIVVIIINIIIIIIVNFKRNKHTKLHHMPLIQRLRKTVRTNDVVVNKCRIIIPVTSNMNHT